VDLTSTGSTYVRDFVIAGVNAPSGSATGSKTFNAPDNLASSVNGTKASLVFVSFFECLCMLMLTLYTTRAAALAVYTTTTTS
jgi:hypothetical protein